MYLDGGIIVSVVHCVRRVSFNYVPWCCIFLAKTIIVRSLVRISASSYQKCAYGTRCLFALCSVSVGIYLSFPLYSQMMMNFPKKHA